MRVMIRAVSKYKDLLVNDDSAWWNASKQAQASLPNDMAQFIGKEVELCVVPGKSHRYSSFALLDNVSGDSKEEKGKPSLTPLPPQVVLTRDDRISRMACLNSSIALCETTKKLEGRTISEAKDVCLTLAEELINWVNGK